MAINSESSSENSFDIFKYNLYFSEDMNNFNNPLDFILPDDLKNDHQHEGTQTDIPVLTVLVSPLVTLLPSNAYDFHTTLRFPNDFESTSSSSTPTTGSPVVYQPPPPLPKSPPVYKSSFTTIKPSTNPFAEPPPPIPIPQPSSSSSSISSTATTIIMVDAETNTEGYSGISTPIKRKRGARPDVTSNEIYKGGQQIPEGDYHADARQIREYNRLMNERVVCCMDHRMVQKILCFKYQENSYICYNCAVNVRRNDISDWSIGMDFTGEPLYQCTRINHARPIWFYINQVKANNMCSLYKHCKYCRIFTKYSALANNRR